MASSIELRVLRAADGDTWRDEVVVLVDDADALATLGRRRWQVWMGLDPARSQGADRDSDFPPAEVVGFDRDEAEQMDCFVARCDCGELGCGALVARISRSADRVVWDRFRDGSDARTERRALAWGPLEFEIAQYEEALQSPSIGGSWQPTTRRAALKAGELVDEVDLTGLRLRAAGFAARGDNEVVCRVMLGRKGDPDFGFLSFGTRITQDESADDLATRVAARITTGAVLTDESVERRPLARPSGG